MFWIRIGRIATILAVALSVAAPDASLRAASTMREPAMVPLDAVTRPTAWPRILALGESSHGNEGMLRVRNHLILQLVRRRAIRWIALETGYAEARLLDGFVRGLDGDAKEVAKRGFTSGFGAFPGNIALLRDVKAANLRRRRKDRVGIVGIDLSLGGPLDSAPTMAPVQCGLEGVTDPAHRESLRAAFVEAVKPGLATASVTDDQKTAFHTLADRLQAALSPAASLEARTCVTIVEKSAEVFDALPKAITPGVIPKDASIAISRRDEAMAANTLNVFRRSGGKSLLLFAHTSHVLNSARRGGQLGMQQRPPRSMGEILRENLGRRYFVVAQVERTRTGDASAPDLVTTLGPRCAEACVVRTSRPRQEWPSTVRIGINGNDEQVIAITAADEYLIRP